MNFEGVMNEDNFQVVVGKVSAPTLLVFNVVQMGNLPSHKIKGIEDATLSLLQQSLLSLWGASWKVPQTATSPLFSSAQYIADTKVRAIHRNPS